MAASVSDLLEAIYNAPGDAKSVELVEQRAGNRAAARAAAGFGAESGTAPADTDLLWRQKSHVWVDYARSLERVETRHDTPDGRVDLYVRGTAGTFRRVAGRVISAEQSESLLDAPLHLIVDPVPLLADLRFSAPRADVVAGRDALTAQATFRHGPFHPGPRARFLAGADEIRLGVDAKTGLLLELAGIAEGEEFFSSNVTQLTVRSGPLPDELFETVLRPAG